jgi:hypothetical protein
MIEMSRKCELIENQFANLQKKQRKKEYKTKHKYERLNTFERAKVFIKMLTNRKVRKQVSKI